MTTAADDLIANLLGVRHVERVELQWGPGLTVKVHLDEMNWATRAAVISEVRGYCLRLSIEQPGTEHAADVRLTFPDPVEFSEARVTA